MVIEIVSGVPVDLAVDSAGTFEDWLVTSPADLLLARGVWPDSWEDKQAVLHDLYPTAQAVRRGFQECSTASALRGDFEPVIGGKGAQRPYKETLIRRLGTFAEAVSWPSYRYRIDGARRSHVVAIDPVLHSDAAAAWSSRLSKPLALFEQIDRPPVAQLGDLEDRAGGTPVINLPRAPSIVADIFGTDRRDPSAPLFPAAPMHLRTDAGHVRFWADGGDKRPITVRTMGKPAQLASPAPAEPMLTVEAIRHKLGISNFALRNQLQKSRYRRLRGQDRERAAVIWMTRKVGREQFIAAVRSLSAEMRRAGDATPSAQIP